MELTQMITRLSEAFGPSGFEGEARAVFEDLVGEVTEVSYDHLGSIVAIHHGVVDHPRILLAAHLDEVGLMVRGILPGGELRVVALGGWWAPALLAQAVVIRSQTGYHPGVIGAKPPHYLKDEERNRQLKLDELYIDVGATSLEEVLAMGIAAGDPVVPAVKTRPMSNSRMVMGKAFDDRIGCAVLAKVLQDLDGAHPNRIIGVGTVQEENGLKGARAVAGLIQPDLCLVLEGAPADDFPGGAIVQGRVGGGPQLRRFDPSMIANQGLVKLVIGEARSLGIPYQVAVREGGGTDGSAIQVHTDGGVPTMVISVPVRYAHSHHGIVNLDDVAATVELVKAIISKLDQTTVNHLQQNPW